MINQNPATARVPEAEVGSKWRVATARRTGSVGPKSIVLFERFPTNDPEDAELIVLPLLYALAALPARITAQHRHDVYRAKALAGTIDG